MLQKTGKRFLAFVLALLLILPMQVLSTFAVAMLNTTVLDGKISVTSDGVKNQGTGVNNDGTITVTTKATANCKGTSYSYTANAHTVLVTNNTADETLMVEFTYVATGLGTLTIDDVAYTAIPSGTYAKSLDPGESVTIVMTSPASGSSGTGAEATIVLSNFALKDTSTKTVTVSKAEGGTTTVNGTVLSAASTTVETDYATGVTVSAAAAGGYTFIGWVDGHGKVLSTSATALIQPLANMTVQAVFVSSNSQGCWLAGEKIHTDLNAAITAAESGNKMIILLNNATLPAGTYTIPAGVTLLIPFDAANTFYADEPEVLQRPGSGVKAPTAYRTLTMASGATLIVNGAVELAARHYAAHGGQIDGGMPVGTYSHIAMSENSLIEVGNGGKLYAWGYVTGSGKVVAKSGAEIYEKMQVSDYRGGTITSAIVPKGCFPFNQYYVQNVEVEETIESGATLICHAGIFASNVETSTVNFMGSGTDSMFSLAEGTKVTKRYDAATDRLVLDADGDISMNAITIMEQNTAGFVLPFNNNITVNILSGTATINQDVLLLPGAQVNVEKNGTLKLASGKRLFLMDLDNWGNYCFGKPMQQIAFVPGKGGAPGIRTAANMTDAKLNIEGIFNVHGQLYASENGALILGDKENPGIIVFNAEAPTEKAFVKQSSETAGGLQGALTRPTDITFNPALLTNGDGSDPVDTSGVAAGTTYTYCGTHEVWYNVADGCVDCCTHEGTVTTKEENRVEATCGEAGSYDFVTYCTKCETVISTEKKTIPATGNHSWNDGVVTTDPTCAKAGVKTYTCSVCGGTKTESVPATGAHTYGTPTYTWSSDRSTCTAKHTCTGAGCTASEECVATVTSEVTTVGTCQVAEVVTYTATFSADWATVQTKSVTGSTNPANHAAQTFTYTDNEDGTHKKVHTCCQVVANGAEPHSYTNGLCYCEAVQELTITWMVEGTAYTSTVEYNQIPEIPAEVQGLLEKTGHTFAWDKEIVAATVDTTYTAVFTPIKYTVTWVDGDGQTIYTEDVAYGTTPAYRGLTPTKSATYQYTYTFAGWDKEIVSVTGEVTYTAVFTEVLREYLITWKDDQGNVIYTEDVAYGKTPAFDATKATNNFVSKPCYILSWSPALSAVTGEATYTAVWTFAAHTEDEDKDHYCDDCDGWMGTCEDGDKDHACDYGCALPFGNCVDGDKDHACDYGCDKVFGDCEDTDKDHACDYGCDKVFGDCVDGDKDHACDYGCDKVFGTCEDGDKDHNCDYGCGKVFGDHIDENNDHTCDYACTEPIGTCEDNDKDHDCDYGCGKVFGTCEDGDKDHVCDYGCDKVYGTCEDTDKDHDCDYGCDKIFGTCEDADKDHACDYGCGKAFGDHIDENNDHTCDYGCAESIGTCEDADKDHTCDYGCGKVFGDHSDSDNDHTCDYGCAESIGTCEDADKDHTCDYGCGKTFGDHSDSNNDHTCDYGCAQSIGTCADADKDHTCDYGCGKAFGTCEDEDHDHTCDYGCGKNFGDHIDGNTDHACDYGCAVKIGEHADAGKDHICDYGCSEKIGEHMDVNTDHVCEYGCTERIGECADNDKDHVCDYGCGAIFGEHVDDDRDHFCDCGCADQIGTCADKNNDHLCDYGCGKAYGEHSDSNNDHACDYGCAVKIGEHSDSGNDHHCDYGCAELIGVCEDKDLDHTCDYGCGKAFGKHIDSDNNHACDYGCAEFIGVCEDKDHDHDCDYGCDKVFGEHSDEDKDHACNYGCAEKIGTCEDKDHDHACDYGCNKVFGEHSDEDKDHICNYGCAEKIGTCEDQDKDHDCDYGCNKVFGEHSDEDKDHICNYGCAEKIGTCEDQDKDHDCDYGCNKVFGEHSDEDKDHAC
ncbi:MAG: hypothetical protein J6R77_02900, partial [Clostridia bacterium]|nr:hypothetical protein [Clostridia bacterium]